MIIYHRSQPTNINKLRYSNHAIPFFIKDITMDKLIIDGKDYGNDYTAYCRAYNNRLREMFIEDNLMKIKDIPIKQKKRPQN